MGRSKAKNAAAKVKQPEINKKIKKDVIITQIL